MRARVSENGRRRQSNCGVQGFVVDWRLAAPTGGLWYGVWNGSLEGANGG